MTAVSSQRYLPLLLLILGLPLGSVAQTADLQDSSIVVYQDSSQPMGRWSVGDTLLHLGPRTRGPLHFSEVVAILALDPNTLLVGDGTSSELRYFDRATGEHLFTVGGEGLSPGQIDRLWMVYQAGSSIVAVDAASRVSRFDRRGRFLSSDPPPISATGLRLDYAGFFDDTVSLAFGAEIPPQVPVGSTLLNTQIVRMSGDEPRFLLRYPLVIATRRENERSRYLGFGPETVLAVMKGRFCVGFPESYEIDCLTASGRHLFRLVRKKWDGKRVTVADRDNYFRARAAANAASISLDTYLQVVRKNQQFAEYYPAFGRLLWSDTGELWVGPFVPEGETPHLYATPQHPTVWSVYSSEGLWLSDITLPANFNLMSIGGNSVAGTMRTSNDSESVAVLSLRRR